MGSPETQPPYEVEEDFEQGQFEEAGALPVNSVTETATIEPVEVTGNVYDFETREKVLEEQTPEDQTPENHSLRPEQLTSAIELLRTDIQELDTKIAKREQLIADHKAYFDKTDGYNKQAELNRALIEDGRQIRVLNNKLDEIAKDRTLFLGRIRNQDLYDKTCAELEIVKQKHNKHRQQRTDESGNYYDLEEILASRKELFEKMKQELGSNMVPNSVYFINLPSRLSEENRLDQKTRVEKLKEIEEFEKQLTLMEAFKK